MKIKFANSQSLFDYDFTRIGLHLIRLTHPSIKQNLSGFRILNDEEQELYIFDDFTVIYESGDGFIDYTDDTSIYNVFAIYNTDGYVISQQVSTSLEIDNGVIIKSGQGKEYANAENNNWFDEDNLYNFKIVDGNVVEVSLEEKEVLLAEKEAKEAEEEIVLFNTLKANKLALLSQECSNSIFEGAYVNGKHYTYDLTDQNDIKTCVEMAITTGMEIPYHATDEHCSLYTVEEIVQIYITQETNLTHHTTYHNQLKLYTSSLTTKEEIEEVVYGQELTGQYLETYNMIMAQADKIIQAYIGGGTA